ncbi:MAG: serine hydrolase domain-containing protein [Chloroflexia bacterium]
MLLARSSPQGAGLDPEKLHSAFGMVASWVEEGVVPGAVALVARRGRVAGTWAGGRLSAEPDAGPVTETTPFAVASITKVVTAIALLRQIDEGKAALDTPAPSIVPEWRVPGAEKITLKHLLSHTSGLPADLPSGALNYEDYNPLEVIVDAFMQVPPRYEPGEKLIYSNIGYGIIWRMLERLSGMGYHELVWRGVLGPLWMNDTWFGNPPEEKAETIATAEGTDRPGTDLDPYNGAYFRGLGHPWGGMFSTAGDVAVLAQVFLDNGRPLLEVNTALAAIRNWTNGLAGGYSTWPRFPTGDWGLGWEIKGARGKHWTGSRTSHATFGHMGASGVFVWADLMQDLICVLLTNRTTGNGWPIAGPQERWLAFSDAVQDAVILDFGF